MISTTLGSPQWRGTYGVLALGVAFAAGLMIYHRARREGPHAAEMAGRFQDALYAMEQEPGQAARELESLAEKSSGSAATPWILQSLAAAYAKEARAGGAASQDLLRKALAAHERVIERHPRHPAAPMSLLASGQIFEDLGTSDLMASTFYARILKEYPGSPAARLVDARFSVTEILEKRRKEGSAEETPMTEQDVIQKKLQISRRRFQEMLALQAEAERQTPEPAGPEPKEPEDDVPGTTKDRTPPRAPENR